VVREIIKIVLVSLALGEVGFRELRTPPKLRAVGIEKIYKEKV